MSRLAVVTSHPIQYNAPVFRKLAARPGLDVRVFYGWEGTSQTADAEFGRTVTWDIPLLDGYEYEFVPNVSPEPGAYGFRGLDNPEMIPRLEAWRPDALLVYGWSFKTNLRVLRHFHGRVPILFRGDSTLIGERPLLKRLARLAALRWVYRHVDLALYVGTHNRRYYEKYGLSEEQLAWAPHTVEMERFQADAERREAEAMAWRRELGIPEEGLVLLFAGKMIEKKAPGLLIEAFARLQREAGSTFHLVLAGDGPLRAALEAESASIPGGGVHFIGFQNQQAMPTVYRLGDVFVLPSVGLDETWGLAVNEAMACGRPVVVSDRVGCAPDLVKPGETGFVVPAGDAEALAAALRQCVEAPEQTRRMGALARERIAGWSEEHLVDVIQREVERLTVGPA